jgi:hypothetical protein
LKLSLFEPRAFLINCLKRAFSIFSFVIKLLIAFIEKSIVVAIFIELAIDSKNAIFRKIASFSSIIIAKFPLAFFIARVIEEALEEVYFSAI